MSLAILAGTLLGAAFPPVPSGVTALIGFLPLFFLLSGIDSYGRLFRYSYVTFFIFSLITTYWTGGFAHLKDWYMASAGLLLLIAHPLFFLIPIFIWQFIRNQFGFRVSVWFFPFIWTGFEYLHGIGELGFPWLALGNTQTYDIPVIQIASITGVYGLTFWITWINVLIFVLLAKTVIGEWKLFGRKGVSLALLILLVYAAPKIYGNFVLQSGPAENPVSVSVVQPDIDTFEKWTVDPTIPLERLLELTRLVKPENPDLVLWPETAVPFYLLRPQNLFYLNRVRSLADDLKTRILTGVPDVVYYEKGSPAPKSSKVSLSGQRYDSFNSSVLITPGDSSVQKYAKMILVPFAERVPFSEELSFLNLMEWNFGLGGWGHGIDTTIFEMRLSDGRLVKFSNLICYESVCPDFVRIFVDKGAEFLTVITNDSWWGNSSGAYQHKQFAALRAVENRRWVVQCANGGISCFIDPSGNIVQQSSMYEKSVLHQKIEPRSDKTVYTRFGDWLAEMCLVISLFFVTAALSSIFYKHLRNNAQ